MEFLEKALGSNAFDLTLIGASFILFQALGRLLAALDLYPRTLDRTPSAQWRWRNLTKSVIHATISGTWALHAVWTAPVLWIDRANAYTYTSHSLLCFSTGYFLHDLLDMMANDRSRGGALAEILLHHSMVLICFPISISLRKYEGACVVPLFCEINSITLHVRQLAKMAHVDQKGRFFRGLVKTNIATFMVFRLIPLLLMYRWVISQKGEMPYSIYLVSFLAGITLVIIQLVLLYRLLVADFALFRARRRDLAAACSRHPACAQRSEKSAAAADEAEDEASGELPFLDALSNGPLDPLEPLFARADRRVIDPALGDLQLDVSY